MTTYRRPLAYDVVQDRSVSPPRSVARIRCSSCDAAETITVRPREGDPEVTIKRFIERGWMADAWKRSHCLCPTCQRTRKANDTDSEIRTEKVIPMHEKKTATEILTETREATPAEKAAIRRKLDECFDDAAGMYLDGSSDQSIGQALNIPWALVRRVREAAYGPIRSDPHLEKARADLKALREELASLVVKVDKAMSDVGAAFKRLGM